MDMSAGRAAEYRRTFYQAEFDRFAALSGDDNPIHVDPKFSAHTRFGRTVAHGMLLYTALCGALQHFCPGAQVLEQELMFPAPTYADVETILRLEVASTDSDGKVWIASALVLPDGSLGLQGRSLVRLPAEPARE